VDVSNRLVHVVSVTANAPRQRPRAISLSMRTRLGGAWAMARYPMLRQSRLAIAPGAELLIDPAAVVSIGPGFVSRRDLTLSVQGTLHIGRGMFCNRGVIIAAMQEVRIGDDVRCGERVSIVDHNHVLEPLEDRDARFFEYTCAPIEIGDRVLIGANAVVLAGARIGDDAVIGAGAVVTGDVPPGTLAVGVPATVRRSLRSSR
jgi:maltose O-acetyltransferase